MYSAVTYISNVDFGSENSELSFETLKIVTQADLNRTRHVNRFEKALDYEENFNFEDLSEPESCDCIVKNLDAKFGKKTQKSPKVFFKAPQG